MGGQEEGGELSCCGGVIMKQIKFQSRTELVLRTKYIVMYAFRSNTELVLVFQSTGNLVPFGFSAESGRNVHPSFYLTRRLLKSWQVRALFFCFICIFFSSLSIAADRLFLIPTKLFCSSILFSWTCGLRALVSALDRIAACPTRDPT